MYKDVCTVHCLRDNSLKRKKECECEKERGREIELCHIIFRMLSAMNSNDLIFEILYSNEERVSE